MRRLTSFLCRTFSSVHQNTWNGKTAEYFSCYMSIRIGICIHAELAIYISEILLQERDIDSYGEYMSYRGVDINRFCYLRHTLSCEMMMMINSSSKNIWYMSGFVYAWNLHRKRYLSKSNGQNTVARSRRICTRIKLRTLDRIYAYT